MPKGLTYTLPATEVHIWENIYDVVRKCHCLVHHKKAPSKAKYIYDVTIGAVRRDEFAENHCGHSARFVHN